MGDIGEYANDYDPTSAGCTGWAEVGPDAAYSITPTAGDIITVDVVADFDSAIYVVTDCASLSTCLVGSDDFGNDETVSFVATGATYFIIVDAFSATGTGVFTMTVSAETPFCTPGSRSCNDGTNVETCNATGTGTDVYPCNTTCTVGSDACDTGSSCANAIPILQSGTINGTYYPWQTNLSPPDVFGYCTDYEAVGPEVVYSVTLTAGQTITATVSATDTNNQDTSIYLITDCAAIGTSCVAGDDAFGTDDSLTYTSIAGGTYYVVVDNYDTVINSDPTFALTVTIQ